MRHLNDRVGIGILANGPLAVARKMPDNGESLFGQVLGWVEEPVDDRQEANTVPAIGSGLGIVVKRAAENRDPGVPDTVGHLPYLATPAHLGARRPQRRGLCRTTGRRRGSQRFETDRRCTRTSGDQSDDRYRHDEAEKSHEALAQRPTLAGAQDCLSLFSPIGRR
jgi:hypothetical protein